MTLHPNLKREAIFVALRVQTKFGLFSQKLKFLSIFFTGCDNVYHGVILPCLLRPDLPPFSYLPAFGYNTEYKKRRK